MSLKRRAFDFTDDDDDHLSKLRTISQDTIRTEFTIEMLPPHTQPAYNISLFELEHTKRRLRQMRSTSDPLTQLLFYANMYGAELTEAEKAYLCANTFV